MKLYLSSYRIGADRNALADLVETPGRAGIVFNALDGFADRLRIFARESDDLSSLGFECEELDLRSYFDDLEGLRDRLSHLQFLWVIGGNSFVLARAMTQSRFGEALHGPLSDGRVVYGGYSAGSCVAAPDLEGIDLVDDPGTIPDGYLGGCHSGDPPASAVANSSSLAVRSPRERRCREGGRRSPAIRPGLPDTA